MQTLIKGAVGAVCAGFAAVLWVGSAHAADAGHVEVERLGDWSFAGLRGQFDKAQLQRGFKVYEKVCSGCHGLSRVNWRNLVQPGGPEFPEEAVKALADKWPNQIPEMNEAGESAVATKDKDGKPSGFKYVTRPAKLSDPIRGPYKNDAEARANQNGALPPDLSLIAKARNPEYTGSVYGHPLHMIGDILRGYQEGGPDYIHALLLGYTDPPEGFQLAEGMNYNKAFPGHQIAMPANLADGLVEYADGPDGKKAPPATLDQYSRDIAAFLAWAADPSLNERKRLGWQVLLYLLITTVLLYLGKRRIWANVEH